MTDRSVPITLDQEYRLQFRYEDIKSLENYLGIGYPHFTRQGIWGSITANEAYLWKGLKKLNPQGNLVYAFPQDESGREIVGRLLWQFTTNGGDPAALNERILEGFVISGVFRKKKREDAGKDADIKNPNG